MQIYSYSKSIIYQLIIHNIYIYLRDVDMNLIVTCIINKVCMLNLLFLPECLHVLCIMHVITLHTFIYSFIKHQHDFLVTC